METTSFEPKVNAAREFIEIATDFSNPLDLVREAISNSFDAKSSQMTISFDVIKEVGERVLRVVLEDNGTGMNEEGIHSFFDLGNSTHRDDDEAIGEKGHGTKVYFNSSNIQVITCSNGLRITAEMQNPFRKLFDEEVPEVTITREHTSDPDGTKIVIKGYNHNRCDLFTHERLKDHIIWFTKVGSVEKQFGLNDHSDFVLRLKGLDRESTEVIPFGHPFPAVSESVSKLFDKHLADAPRHFCSRMVKQMKLRQHPDISIDAVFFVEGNRVKQEYNPMIRRRGYQAPDGSYTVQERYGIWLCKDYIPVQSVNDWVSVKGREYTRLHAFVNCQELRLTANRGSINNTPSEILTDVRVVVEDIYESLTTGQDWIDMDWLSEEAEGFRNTEREKSDFKNRCVRFNQANIASYKDHDLIQPSHESGVFGLLMKLSTIESSLFPFKILDYNTYTGIDLIVKGDHTTPLAQSRLYYVELKYILGNSQLNHSFENLSTIICWDTALKHGDIIEDLNGEKRQMQIFGPTDDSSYTSYLLDGGKKNIKIEVVVLKDYLRERFGIEFRPRAGSSTI